jgi:hypothetical protein
MPQVLNVRHLPGFSQRRPALPPGAVYIGRANARYHLRGSFWANVPLPPQATSAQRVRSIADYETALRCDPVRLAKLPELRGRDLYCWCAPKPCHGDVLLRLANAP